MNRKFYWGIASLILIIGVVGIYFMLQPDPEPKKDYIVPTEADLKKAREAGKPPPGASPNGHWNDGVWHNESHAPIVQVSDELDFPRVTDMSLPGKVAASDDVPKYVQLKAKSDKELMALMDVSYKEMELLSPQLKKYMNEWTKASAGSDQEKNLQKLMDEVAWKYNVAAITSHKASKVFQRRFIEYHSSLPDHPARMTIHPLPGNLVDEHK